MLIAILILLTVIGSALMGVFIYKQHYWGWDIDDNTPFGLWISCIIFSGILTLVAFVLLLIKLVHLI